MTRNKDSRKFSKKANINKEGAKMERKRKGASFCLRFLHCAKEGVSQKTKKSLSYFGIQSRGREVWGVQFWPVVCFSCVTSLGYRSHISDMELSQRGFLSLFCPRDHQLWISECQLFSLCVGEKLANPEKSLPKIIVSVSGWCSSSFFFWLSRKENTHY